MHSKLERSSETAGRCAILAPKPPRKKDRLHRCIKAFKEITKQIYFLCLKCASVFVHVQIDTGLKCLACSIQRLWLKKIKPPWTRWSMVEGPFSSDL